MRPNESGYTLWITFTRIYYTLMKGGGGHISDIFLLCRTREATASGCEHFCLAIKKDVIIRTFVIVLARDDGARRNLDYFLASLRVGRGARRRPDDPRIV